MRQLNVSERRPLDWSPWLLLVGGLLLLGLGLGVGFACREVKDGWMLVMGVSLPVIGLVFGLACIYKGLTRLAFFRLNGAPVFSVHTGGIHLLGEKSRLLSWAGIRTAEVREDTSPARLVVTLKDESTCTIDLSACQVDQEQLDRNITRLATAPPSADLWLVCPVCGYPSNSLKTYTIFALVFLFIIGGSQVTRGIGCPACMRRHTADFLRLNLITANVCWPFVILPWGIWLLFRSLTHGHNEEVLEQIIADERNQNRPPSQQPGSKSFACGTCGRSAHLSEVDGRQWCAWCSNWASK